MSTHDNIMIPILITDKNGIIICKNRAAKRCIPSPRLKGNINNYLNPRMKAYRIHNGNIRLEFIKNSKSAFNRALVFSDEDEYEGWLFFPELLIYEPEEIGKFIDKINVKLIRKLLEDLQCLNNTSDHMLFVRYQRVYTELLSVIREIVSENSILHFGALDILCSLKEKTDKLASLYGLRMTFDIGLTDPWQPYQLKFEMFGSAYIQLLSLALRITDTTGCSVSAFLLNSELILTVTSSLSDSLTDQVPFVTKDTLYQIYPEQTSNILLLEETVKAYGFGLDISVRDGRLAFDLCVPLKNIAQIPLYEEPPRIVVMNRFDRLEKRFCEYLEAMLLQI